MKREYRVEWYDFNLTQKKSRKFFTETGASLFVWYLHQFYDVAAKVYRI